MALKSSALPHLIIQMVRSAVLRESQRQGEVAAKTDLFPGPANLGVTHGRERQRQFLPTTRTMTRGRNVIEWTVHENPDGKWIPTSLTLVAIVRRKNDEEFSMQLDLDASVCVSYPISANHPEFRLFGANAQLVSYAPQARWTRGLEYNRDIKISREALGGLIKEQELDKLTSIDVVENVEPIKLYGESQSTPSEPAKEKKVPDGKEGNGQEVESTSATTIRINHTQTNSAPTSCNPGQNTRNGVI